MKKPLFSLLLVVIILASTFFVGGVFAAPAEKIPVIIGFKAFPEASLITANSGEITHQFHIIHAISCSLTPQVISILQKNPRIAYIEEDIQVSATTLELDNSWGVNT